MKTRKLILLLGSFIVFCLVAYYWESTLAAVFAYCAAWALVFGIWQNITAWLDKLEQKEKAKPL
jgi:hypothetical protein